jgi:hypothetical protein
MQRSRELVARCRSVVDPVEKPPLAETIAIDAVDTATVDLDVPVLAAYRVFGPPTLFDPPRS